MRESVTTLGRESDSIRAYLDILKVRMEDRLEVHIDVADGLRSALFPPMMLQTLVENAIKHGLEPCCDAATLHVQAHIVDGNLEVSVTDTGLGFDPANASTKGTGLGLSNIRERLGMLYGQAARLEIASISPRGTCAKIVVPYQAQRMASMAKPSGDAAPAPAPSAAG
jgi:LytS/YehU family sensor histidine kinase